MTRAATDVPRDVPPSGQLMRSAAVAAGRIAARYVRLELDTGPGLPDGPALIVLNHGFGALTDLNVLISAHILDQLGFGPDQPAVMLTHRMAWVLGVGPLLEPAGLRRADPDVARKALDAGVPVFVMPGGDRDGAKSWRDRNRVNFNGRSGFARLARDSQAPIVPIVITGAGDTLIGLSDGQWLAERTGLTRIMRQNTAPVSFALPWSVNVGAAALLGYLPWPAKMRARVCDPVTISPDEEPKAAAARVCALMNDAADAMTRGRNPYLDWLRRPSSVT